MLILILFACLVTNFYAIKCDDNSKIVYVVLFTFDNEQIKCFVNNNYTIENGSNITVMVENQANKKMGSSTWIKREDNFEIDKNVFNTSTVTVPGSYGNYSLDFRFNFVENTTPKPDNVAPLAKCTTGIFAAPDPALNPETEELIKNLKMYSSAVGIILTIIIIALAATTIYYRRKFKASSRHINLNMVKEKIEDDERETDRYCSNPRPKTKKGAQFFDIDRESAIYEDPKVTLGASSRPPPLPNLDTLKKISIANRPPLPTPKDEDKTEPQEDDTYETPPDVPTAQKPSPPKLVKKDQIDKTVPKHIARSRPTMPLKPPVQQKLGNKLKNIPMDGLKPPGFNSPHKPPVSQNKPTPPRNNENKPTPPRNNAVQIQTIPDTSSLKRAPLVKPKPPAALPKTLPIPPMGPEEEDNRDSFRESSDDEEWTYEPLPQINIYSI